MKFNLIKSPNPEKKYRGIFIDDSGKETHIDFGQRGADDMTTHKNVLRRQRYIQRHKARENWNSPLSAGALSRWLLWETPNLQTNVKLFKQNFNLQ